MSDEAVISVKALGFPWETSDPFLFCVHHDDAYPAGNPELGPAASLAGRDLGQDFAGKDGWRMYHGQRVPGFPPHPHRGFETVTIVRSGFIDHSDSLGATARFGNGDAQWLTAGAGIVHSEMFPLLNQDAPNPVELFQIWLNLPSADKLADPWFGMFWSHQIPRYVAPGVEVAIVAGSLGDLRAPPPPPRSWAARPDTDVAIWTLKLAPFARWTLPAAGLKSTRNLYFFKGSELAISGRKVGPSVSVGLRPGSEVLLENGATESELLLLQGRPIAESVAQHGPFVMNTRAELQQAFADYQRTGFGGWPWPSEEPVHPRDAGRFAKSIGDTIRISQGAPEEMRIVSPIKGG